MLAFNSSGFIWWRWHAGFASFCALPSSVMNWKTIS